jgi:phosphohistidine phosphatase
MELYLVRHAIAEDHAAGRDEDRGLTGEGKTKMIRAARGLRKFKLKPDLILTSPLRRARETAEILARELNGAPVEVMPELAASADVKAVAPALRPQVRLASLVLVGHQPNLGELASLLLTGGERRLRIDFKKGGVACLEADLAADPPQCVLRWLVTPGLLRAL